MPFGSLSGSQRVTVLLEILGGPKYAASMRAAGAETKALGAATRTASNATAVMTRRTWLQNQALFTMRRYAFYGTLALSAMAVAVFKLGFSYLSAMQNARVALSPVIKDQAKLNSYLKELFTISKYSPFVIKDMTIAFRTMYAQMSHVGISGQTIVHTLKAIADYLSFTGHTAPADLNRVSNALSKMANLGRLTGRTILSLASGGVPIYDILNKKLGITRDQLAHIANLNIAPNTVLQAILSYAKGDKGVSGAAQRLSLSTFSGLLQVARDTISQLSGNLVKSSYKGGQGFLGGLFGPKGQLNQLANYSQVHTGTQTVLQISKSMTGHTGLGQGFLLVLQTLKLIASVFAHIVVPAFVLGLHSLIVFYPALKLLNILLGFATHHTTVFTIALGFLAVEFIVTHAAALALWSGMKLIQIATFGAIPALMKMIKWIKILRTVELAGLIKRLYAWAFAQKVVAGATYGAANTMKYINGPIAKMVRGIWLATAATWAWITANRALLVTWLGPLGFVGIMILLYFKVKLVRDTFNLLWRNLIYWAPVVALALTEAFGPIYAAAAAIALIIRYQKQIRTTLSPTKSPPQKQFKGGWWNPATWGLYVAQHIPHAATGMHSFSGGPMVVGEHGPELAMFPSGTRIVPNQSVSGVVNSSSLSDKIRESIVVHSQLVVDRKVLAESVARANQDKKSTMD